MGVIYVHLILIMILLSYNWQLDEDKTLFFIKYGYVWFFSGFDKRVRNELMDQTWDIVKGNYE